MIEGNEPGNDAAEFDRLMALEDEGQETGKENEADEASPAQAAETTATEATGDQGAATGDGEGGGTSAEPAAATDATQQEQDWLAQLPEEVQTRIKAEREARDAELQAERDRYKALHGRVAPVQQALNEAQRRLHQQSQTSPAATPAAPTQGDNQTLDSYFDSAGWKQWEADFPGDAKVLRAGLEAQQKAAQQAFRQLEEQVQGLTQRLGQTEQVASRTVQKDELSVLEAKHSDWQEINDSDEFWEFFESWRATQPKSVRDTYYDKNKLNAMFNDSEFVIAILDDYKAQRQAVAPPVVTTEPVTPPESTQPAQTPPAPNARLAMSVAPDVRGGSPVPQIVSLDTLSPGEAFEHVWASTPD